VVYEYNKCTASFHNNFIAEVADGEEREKNVCEMEEVDTGTVWQFLYKEVRIPLLGNCPQEQYYDEEEGYEEDEEDLDDDLEEDIEEDDEEEQNSELLEQEYEEPIKPKPNEPK